MFLRARYYDPAIGRFMGRDRHHGKLITSSSLNRYTYTENNPIGSVDPSGKYKYQYDWNLGPAGTLTASDAMSYFLRNPREIFPFGLGECDTITQGRTCGLTGALPGSLFAGRSDPVVVKDVTATSFTFEIEPGHFDYNADGTGFVEFSVHVKNGNLFLRQRAVATWQQQAQNLARALGRDPAEVILSNRTFTP